MSKSNVITYKGFKIKKVENDFVVYTADEWIYGEGFRYPEHEAGTLQEAKDFIDSY
ncbi:hypothetical protein ABE137_12420 [Brevibacillus laterosporus]|uniref:hypothetical protein n=1 Tax=Brevibacillus laterosporus TaxID=1465 RepID=UPI003D2585D4